MKRWPFLMMAALVFFAGCARPKTVQKTETIMGTEVTVTVVARSGQDGAAAIDAAMAEIKRFDAMMSLYKDTSDITRVNLAAGKHPVTVSPEMIEVVEAAERVSKLSGGVFDVTIGPLVVLWQMRLRENRVPTEAEIALARSRVGYKNIVIDKRASTLFLKKTGMIMDLGGMKGYIADRARDIIKKRGINDAVLALAGDIWVLGHRPDGTPWRIGVQHPREHDKTLTVLELSDKYISTSGDYERFVIRENKRYHHIIDPRTGKPSKGVISATLIGDQGALIDPLTKVPFIVGPEEGIRIVKQLGAAAIIVDDEGRVSMTGGIKGLQEPLVH